MTKTYEAWIVKAAAKQPNKRSAIERKCITFECAGQELASRTTYAKHYGRYVATPADDSKLFVIWDNLNAEIIETFATKQQAGKEAHELNTHFDWPTT